MKITANDYVRLETACKKVLQAVPTAAQDYCNGKFPRADKVSDLQTRFNFDVFHAACKTGDVTLCDDLYSYLDDRHIATALRKILPEVVKQY